MMNAGGFHVLVEPTPAGDVVLWLYRRHDDEAKPSVVDILSGRMGEITAFSLSRSSLKRMSNLVASQEFDCGEIFTVKEH